MKLATLCEHDRSPFEGDETAKLADEGGKRLLDLERRVERPRAAVRGVEEVGAPTELVAQRLGLAGSALGKVGLCAQPLYEPSDEEARDQADPDGEGDVVDVIRVIELTRAQPLEDGIDRRKDEREHDPS